MLGKNVGTYRVLRPQYDLQNSVSHSLPALSPTNAVSHKLHSLGGIPLAGEPATGSHWSPLPEVVSHSQHWFAAQASWQLTACIVAAWTVPGTWALIPWNTLMLVPTTQLQG